MGSCLSIHKKSASGLKIQTSIVPEEDDKPSFPSTPIKEKSAIVEPPIFSPGCKYQLNSVTSYSIHGSKEETFYDSQVWIDSDCDDDFYSVNGDFTPSRGSTPVHYAAGTPGMNRVFSTQLNKALFEGRPPLYSASNRSRGSTPVHQSIYATSTPEVNSNPDSYLTTKKKKLGDLFRENIRDRGDENQTLTRYVNEANQTKSSNLTPESNSTSKRTPVDDYYAPEKNKSRKSMQCCFSRRVSSRNIHENKKASRLPMDADDLKA